MNDSVVDEFQTIYDYFTKANVKNRKQSDFYEQQLREPRFRPLLINLLSSPDLELRDLAAQYLAETDYSEAYPVLLKLLIEGNSSRAARILGKLKYQLAIPALTQILQDKKRPIWLRIKAAEALGNFDNDEVIESLAQVFLDEEDNEFNYYEYKTARFYAAQSLSNFGDRVWHYFEQALASPNDLTLLNSIEQLDKFDLHLTAKVIDQALENQNYLIRNAAVEVVGKIRYSSATDVLLKMVANLAEKVLIRDNAALSLGQLGDKNAINYLLAILQNTRILPFNITRANMFLEELSDIKAEDPFRTLLRSRKGAVILDGVKALAALRSKKDLDNIEQVTPILSELNKLEEQLEQALTNAVIRQS